MICNMCKKLITDNHFKKTKKYYYHLDKCWWQTKKVCFVVIPLILGIAFLFGIAFLILEIRLTF